jgi:predicted metal-dependent RNase
VIIKTTKPGLIIGKGGAGIEELKKKVVSKLGLKNDLKINIEEVRDINLHAQVIATQIAEQLEKRASFRKLMKQSIEQVMNAGAKGVKIAWACILISLTSSILILRSFFKPSLETTFFFSSSIPAPPLPIIKPGLVVLIITDI